MLKRGFDIAVALAGLFLTSPLLLLTAIAVKATSRGPVFYRALRAGRDGMPFRMLKFRSMAETRDAVQPKITRAGDPRITPVGRLLRRTKIDELPQLINVLRGEMSMVGPRPEHPDYVALYDARQRGVLSVRPGLTSLASMRYRDEESHLANESWHDTYLSVIMPAKLDLDLYYIATRSFAGDLRIIAATFLSLFFRR